MALIFTGTSSRRRSSLATTDHIVLLLSGRCLQRPFFVLILLPMPTDSNAPAPKLSIICPIRNAMPYVIEMIDSVLAQSYPDWELVFADGASTDGTLETLARYAAKDPRIKFHSEPDESSWDALDKGLKRSRGKYITIMCGNDGFLDNEWFAKAMAVLEKDEEVALVWSLNIVKGVDGTILETTHGSYSHFAKSENFLTKGWLVARKGFLVVYNLTFGDPIHREIFWRKMFSNTIFFKLNFFFRRDMPKGHVPQKQAWFRYWLDTATIFPDESLIVDKRVFVECAPRYGTSNDLDPMYGFYFNVNAKGYLPWYIPTHATFGRMHPGTFGEREPMKIFESTERFLKDILVLRKSVVRQHQPVVFRDRNGKIIEE